MTQRNDVDFAYEAINSVFGMLADVPRPTELPQQIAWALLHASLEDGLACVGLLAHAERPLISPALTLIRPMTEKLKRAQWAHTAPSEEVVRAFEADKLLPGDAMVRKIEADDQADRIFSKIFGATPKSHGAFVHGGRLLIELLPYFRDGALVLDQRVVDSTCQHIGHMAIEAGFAGADIVGTYNEAHAHEIHTKLLALTSQPDAEDPDRCPPGGAGRDRGP